MSFVIFDGPASLREEWPAAAPLRAELYALRAVQFVGSQVRLLDLQEWPTSPHWLYIALAAFHAWLHGITKVKKSGKVA